jgi:hypothetical protein
MIPQTFALATAAVIAYASPPMPRPVSTGDTPISPPVPVPSVPVPMPQPTIPGPCHPLPVCPPPAGPRYGVLFDQVNVLAYRGSGRVEDKNKA